MQRITIARGDVISPEIRDATLQSKNAAGAQLEYDEISFLKKIKFKHMKTLEKKELKFIDSTFSPIEASNLLSELINSKISYHKIDDFSQHIRFERDSQHSKNRIEELQKTQEELREFINVAKTKGVELLIKSTIYIEYAE